jgi:hypothetical protein
LIKAAIPISGVYDFSGPEERREFFTDASDRVASSPLRVLSSSVVPMLVTYGSDENQPTYGIDSGRLVDAVRARGGDAELVELEGMTHADTVDALGDAASPLFDAVMRLLARTGVVSVDVAVG